MRRYQVGQPVHEAVAIGVRLRNAMAPSDGTREPCEMAAEALCDVDFMPGQGEESGQLQRRWSATAGQ